MYIRIHSNVLKMPLANAGDPLGKHIFSVTSLKLRQFQPKVCPRWFQDGQRCPKIRPRGRSDREKWLRNPRCPKLSTRWVLDGPGWPKESDNNSRNKDNNNAVSPTTSAATTAAAVYGCGCFWLRPFLAMAVSGCGCFLLWLFLHANNHSKE